MSTITVELIIKMKTKFTSSNAEKTNEKTNGFMSRMSEIFTARTLRVLIYTVVGSLRLLLESFQIIV